LLGSNLRCRSCPIGVEVLTVPLLDPQNPGVCTAAMLLSRPNRVLGISCDHRARVDSSRFGTRSSSIPCDHPNSSPRPSTIFNCTSLNRFHQPQATMSVLDLITFGRCMSVSLLCTCDAERTCSPIHRCPLFVWFSPLEDCNNEHTRTVSIIGGLVSSPTSPLTGYWYGI